MENRVPEKLWMKKAPSFGIEKENQDMGIAHEPLPAGRERFGETSKGILFYFLFLKRFYLFMRDTHRERQQRHRRREKHGPRGEPDMGLDSRTPGSRLS